MSQWYLLRAATRQENRAVRSLKEVGLHGYCPMRTVWDRSSKEKDATRPTALFPGYIFALIPEERGVAGVDKLDGVHAIVRTTVASGEKVKLPVHPRFVESLIMCEALGLFDDTYKPPKAAWTPEKGERVRGIAGAMDGYVGEVLKVKGERSLKVLFEVMDAMGRSHTKAFSVKPDEVMSEAEYLTGVVESEAA